MIRPVTHLVVVAIAISLTASDAYSRGGGRGPGGGGGGRGAAMSRGGGGAARTPSMSRAAPSRSNYSRPSTGRPNVSQPNISRPNVSRPNTSRPDVSRPNISRPNTGGANRPNISRPNTGGASRPNIERPNVGGGTNRPNIGGGNAGNRPNVNRPNTGGGNRPNLSGRPSQGDLKDFLDLPGGGPSTRPATRPGSGDRPNLANRPGQGNRPGVGNRPGGGDRPNFERPDFGNRPDIGDRPNIGDRPGPGNRPGDRPDIGNRPGRPNRPDRPNRPNRPDYDRIRDRWDNNPNRPFDRNWWGRYPATRPGWGWHAGWNRYPNNWYWRHAAWPVVGSWFVWNWAQPVTYSYGTDVVYRDNYVYVNDQQVCTTEQYYDQALNIADSVPAEPPAEDSVEWLPLGVFAIAEQGGVDNGMLIQLAVTKEGVIAGTFYNDATSDGRPLEGMVDRESQRAAWRFADGKNPDVVMETPIYNLTQDETTALVHFGDAETQTWLMVRLPQEDDQN